jgi:hypothetical protein
VRFRVIDIGLPLIAFANLLLHLNVFSSSAMNRFLGCCLLFSVVCLGFIGCGKPEPTVIEPGAGYQMTPEEQTLMDKVNALPGSE